MANVTFHRTYRTGNCRPAVHFRQACKLDRISERGGGAMSFNVSDGGGIDSGGCEGGGKHFRLPIDAGCGVADLVSTVIIDRGTQNHAPYRVVIAKGVVKTFENHDSAATPAANSVAVGVEWPAVPIRGINHAFLKVITRLLRKAKRDSSRERHVTLACQKSLAGHVNRYQRCGTSGLHSDAGASQIQLVTDAAG